eukprot:s473_g16.t1
MSLASNEAPVQRPWQGSSEAALQWLLSPEDVGHFFSDYWEKQPLHLRRNQQDRYAGLMSQTTIEAEAQCTVQSMGSQSGNALYNIEAENFILCNPRKKSIQHFNIDITLPTCSIR